MSNRNDPLGLAPERELARLRELLLGEHPRRIDEIAERLNDPTRRSREIGAVLPYAISRHGRDTDDLPEALEPQVEEALVRSIRRDPSRVSTILSPVMGPAIRRSVRQALAGLAQRVNETVEQSLTLRGLRLRLEAARTGVPFSDLVLRDSLEYRVEQLFLIHRETSLLLAEALQENVATRDPEIVSSMLAVIQDFVRDSMDVAKDEVLDSVQVGELTVWIEPGPHAFVAAVIRGRPPRSLHRQLADLVSELHREYQHDFERFDGELAPFGRVPRRLSKALVSQPSAKRGRAHPLTWVLAASVALLMAGLLGAHVAGERKLDRLVDALDAEPGLVVLQSERRGRRFIVRGLRDARGSDPATVVERVELAPDQVEFRWESYVSGISGSGEGTW